MVSERHLAGAGAVCMGLRRRGSAMNTGRWLYGEPFRAFESRLAVSARRPPGLAARIYSRVHGREAHSRAYTVCPRGPRESADVRWLQRPGRRGNILL